MATYIPPTYPARIYVGLGERDQALAWLEKGHAARGAHMEFLGVEPDFDPLRSDPRFVDLLRRVNLVPKATSAAVTPKPNCRLPAFMSTLS
jgi:hypothetical protein